MARLQNVESDNKKTNESLQLLSQRMENQSKILAKQQSDLTQLGQAVTNQATSIGQIQETQITQGNSIVNINNLQSQMLNKITLILKNQQAKNPHGDGESKC